MFEILGQGTLKKLKTLMILYDNKPIGFTEVRCS